MPIFVSWGFNAYIRLFFPEVEIVKYFGMSWQHFNVNFFQLRLYLSMKCDLAKLSFFFSFSSSSLIWRKLLLIFSEASNGLRLRFNFSILLFSRAEVDESEAEEEFLLGMNREDLLEDVSLLLEFIFDLK